MDYPGQTDSFGSKSDNSGGRSRAWLRANLIGNFAFVLLTAELFSARLVGLE